MNTRHPLQENPQYLRGRAVSRQRRRFRDLFAVIGLAVALVAASLWIAAKYSDLRQVGYDMVDLRDQTLRLRADRDKLRAELAALTRPERILPLALEQGMRPLNPDQVVTVRIMPETLPPIQDGVDMVARLDDENQ